MLENQRTTLETVTALKQAANASKSTMQELDIGKVRALLHPPWLRKLQLGLRPHLEVSLRLHVLRRDNFDISIATYF